MALALFSGSRCLRVTLSYRPTWEARACMRFTVRATKEAEGLLCFLGLKSLGFRQSPEAYSGNSYFHFVFEAPLVSPKHPSALTPKLHA